jgi:hypothetical protein
MPAVPILFMEVATELPLAKACNMIPRAGHDVERLWRECALRRSGMIRGLSARELTTVREDSEPMRRCRAPMSDEKWRLVSGRHLPHDCMIDYYQL